MSINSVNLSNNPYYFNSSGTNDYQTSPLKDDTEIFGSFDKPNTDTIEFSSKKETKDGFDYSIDDGKISTADKVKNFAKGIISSITSMFSSPVNFAIGAGMIAGSAALIAATGGAAAPVMVTLGLATGALQLGHGIYKATAAKTDEEAEQAWQGIGAGTSAVASSVLGSKSALKASGVNTSKMGYLEATVQCVKQTPSNLSKSVAVFMPKKGVTVPSTAVLEGKAVEENKVITKPENTKVTETTTPDAENPVKITSKKEAAPSGNEYKLSEKSIKAGTSYLAEEGTPEYDAISKLMEKEFVTIRDKESAVSIFKKEFASLDIQSGDDVYILNPSDVAKSAHKNIGTSNTYMSKWYAEATGLDGKILTTETIQEALLNSTSDKVTIIVPDDCAITGRSMIVDTAKALNGIDLPEGKSIRLVYSPMVESSTATSAFKATAAFDLDGLTASKALNSSDNDIISAFFGKYEGKIDISTAQPSVKVRPYYETECFQALKADNPDLAQSVEAILTYNGTAVGFGRPGTSGVMIATPAADGVTLKCPNNNVYGAAPYALAEGASYDTIKLPSKKLGGEKTSPAKWQFLLKEMLKQISENTTNAA